MLIRSLNDVKLDWFITFEVTNETAQMKHEIILILGEEIQFLTFSCLEVILDLKYNMASIVWANFSTNEPIGPNIRVIKGFILILGCRIDFCDYFHTSVTSQPLQIQDTGSKNPRWRLLERDSRSNWFVYRLLQNTFSPFNYKISENIQISRITYQISQFWIYQNEEYSTTVGNMPKHRTSSKVALSSVRGNMMRYKNVVTHQSQIYFAHLLSTFTLT